MIRFENVNSKCNNNLTQEEINFREDSTEYKIDKFDKMDIMKRYNAIELKDVNKEYLHVLSENKGRYNTAIKIMRCNFTDDDINFVDFNFMILLASIIIELEI